MRKAKLDEERSAPGPSGPGVASPGDSVPAAAAGSIAAGAPSEETPEPFGAAAEPAIDYKDRWLRAEAEFQNFRRRAQRDLEEAVRSTEERALLEMIAMLDDLERGLDAARQQGAPDSWVQGVQLVANRARDILARNRVVPMDPIGASFDPEFHEAMLEVDPGEAIPGTVVQVVRQGYQRDGRALRPARVVVARRAEG